MLHRVAADATLLVHLAFILFVAGGALLAMRLRWMPLIHLPAALWGVFIEISGRDCPLTHLENYFRVRAGQAGFAARFIEHYLLGVIYPDGLTREAQYLLAAVVLLLNIGIYGWLIHRRTWQRGEA